MIEEILNNIGLYISNFGNSVLNFFVSIGSLFESISTAIVNVGSFIISVFGFIYYAGRTLLLGIWNLLSYIIDSDVWVNVGRAMVKVSDFIGGPATIFILSLLVIIIVRIIVAFIFKLLRLNIDYNSFDKQTRTANAWSRASEHHKRMNTRV